MVNRWHCGIQPGRFLLHEQYGHAWSWSPSWSARGNSRVTLTSVVHRAGLMGRAIFSLSFSAGILKSLNNLNYLRVNRSSLLGLKGHLRPTFVMPHVFKDLNDI